MKLFTKKPITPSTIVLLSGVLGLLAYISFTISATVEIDARGRLLAYGSLFSGIVFATSLPNALIPDRLLGTYQLGNASPPSLLNAQLVRWCPWIVSMYIPTIVIAFSELPDSPSDLVHRTLLVSSHLAIVTGTGLYGLATYFAIGPASQQWQEGSSGGWWDALTSYIPTIQPQVPRGLLPALSATSRVFGINILCVVATMYLIRDVGWIHGTWPGLILVGVAFVKLYRLRPHFDRYYYHTNAFYGELLRSGSFITTVKETTPYEALYWVPDRWRPHVWASLVQLERAIPLGRFAAMAMAGIWILSWTNASQAVLSVCLLGILLAKNLSVLTFSRQDLSAMLLRHTMQSVHDWGITRGFVNLKWTVLIAVSLVPVAWLDSGFTWQHGLLWIGADISLSFSLAWIITYATTRNERNVYAG